MPKQVQLPSVLPQSKRGEVLAYENEDDDTSQNRPKRAREVHQSKLVRDAAPTEPDSILDEFDIIEQQILNDRGEVDHEKLRQLEKKGIQPLSKVDHSQIEYEAFEKDFYIEHPEVAAMNFEAVGAKR